MSQKHHLNYYPLPVQQALTGHNRIVPSGPNWKTREYALFPALALPVVTKSDFACPAEHLDVLQEFIPNVTKLMVIGWRARDEAFLRLLASKIQNNLRVMVVAGNPVSAREVIQNLKNQGIRGDYSSTSGGFTEMILNHQAEDFLRSG